MKIKLYIALLLFSFKASSSTVITPEITDKITSDITDEIATAIKSGNSKALSAYFTDNVDLKVLAQEDVYSKAQAELIVKDFFAKNLVKSFTIEHKSTKNESRFAIGKLESANGKFRVYFLLKKSAGKLKIQQFRIEPENE